MLGCEIFFIFDETCDSDLLLHGIYLIHFSVSIDDHNTNFMSLSYSDHIANIHKKLLMVHRMHMVCTQENDKESRMPWIYLGRVKGMIQIAFHFSICSLICGVVCLRYLRKSGNAVSDRPLASSIHQTPLHRSFKLWPVSYIERHLAKRAPSSFHPVDA